MSLKGEKLLLNESLPEHPVKVTTELSVAHALVAGVPEYPAFVLQVIPVKTQRNGNLGLKSKVRYPGMNIQRTYNLQLLLTTSCMQLLKMAGYT